MVKDDEPRFTFLWSMDDDGVAMAGMAGRITFRVGHGVDCGENVGLVVGIGVDYKSYLSSRIGSRR